MNYITEIKGFHDLVQTKQLSTGQIALWYALMYINNKCAWVEWFTASNLSLELHSGLSRQGIVKNRNALKQLGLIDFKSNGTKACSYKMLTTSNSVQDSLQVGVQASIQASVRDSVQASVQDSSALNKLNINETNSSCSSYTREDISLCVQKYESCIGTISETVAWKIEDRLKDGLTYQLICKAMETACVSNKRSWSYVDGILRNCITKNVFTVEAFDTDNAARNTPGGKTQPQNKGGNQFLRLVKESEQTGSDETAWDNQRLLP